MSARLRRCAFSLLSLLALTASVLSLGVVVASSPASAAVDYTGIRINEVESNGDPVGDWVELTNVSGAVVDVSGMKLLDNDNTHAFVAVPAGTSLAPGGYYAVYVDTPQQPGATGGFGLGGSDSARLYAPDATSGTATPVDSYTWTAHATTTYGRCPDGLGSFVTTTASTRGAANACPVKPVVINEVESNGDAVHGDWVEVRNTTASPIDISGYSVLDNDSTHTPRAFPSGTILAAGGYQTIQTDTGTGSFGLGAPDQARLFDAGGTLVDAYTWSTHATTTYARCPDGSGPFTTSSTSTYNAVNDCSSPVRINEVESDGGAPADWVELYNSGVTAVDVSGWVLKDSVDSDVYALPASTSIAAGGYLVLDQAQFGFELDAADSVRLYLANGTTLADSYSWTTAATTTYGRCPNGTGAFTTTQQATKGGLNNCPGDLQTSPWPGGAAISTIDDVNVFGTNLSGLAYQGTGTTTPGTLWAVKNGPGTLYKLARTGSTWGPAPGDWAAGKVLHYADGTGDPDAEGVTFTGAGPDAGMYASTERNNANGGVSRPAILRFDPTTPGTTLNAQRDYDLTADLPTLGANLGLEGIAWVPDSYLTSHGLVDDSTGVAYTPSSYPDHGTGIFLVGVEQNGMVYGYALDQGSNTYHRVTSFASGFSAVMELGWDTENQLLRVVCDDTCQGRSGTFTVSGGHFTAGTYYERPAGMPNLNNEGFVVSARSECVNGLKPVFYADDTNDDGHALRAGTISCTPPAAQTVTITSTAPSAPVVGSTYAVTATGGASGNPVVLSASPSSVCSISGATVSFDHVGTCVVSADQAGSEAYTSGSASQSITVGQAPGSVMITSTPPASPALGSTYAVTTTAGPSSGAVSLGVAPSSVCSISGTTVTLAHAGTCTVTATQAGDADHAAASDTQGVTVAKATQNLFITSTPPPSPVVGSTYAVTTSPGASGNPVVLSSTTPTVCSLSGSTLTFAHAGACTVQATQDGSADYEAASASQTVTVAPGASATSASFGPAGLTVTVTAVAPATAVPTGSVSVTVDGVTTTAPLDGGVASFGPVAPADQHQVDVDVRYPGSADYAASSAAASRTAPTLTAVLSGVPTAFAWFGAPVTVTFTCAAGTAPLTGACPGPVTLGEGRDQTVSRTVTSADGASATTASRPVDVDLTDPIVRIAGVAAGTTYRGAAPTPSCVGTDALSGVATCHVSSTRSGLSVTVRAVATDLAGHTASTALRYRLPAYRVVGATYADGTYRLLAGQGHQLRVTLPAAATPRLVGPLQKGDHFDGRGRALNRVGDVGAGLVEWRSTVTLPASARVGQLWKVGVVVGGTTVPVQLKVGRG